MAMLYVICPSCGLNPVGYTSGPSTAFSGSNGFIECPECYHMTAAVCVPEGCGRVG